MKKYKKIFRSQGWKFQFWDHICFGDRKKLTQKHSIHDSGFEQISSTGRCPWFSFRLKATRRSGSQDRVHTWSQLPTRRGPTPRQAHASHIPASPIQTKGPWGPSKRKLNWPNTKSGVDPLVVHLTLNELPNRHKGRVVEFQVLSRFLMFGERPVELLRKSLCQVF